MISELQREVAPWVLHNFEDCPSWMPLVGIMEELGELAHAHLKEAQGIRVNEDYIKNAKDAIGDIMIYLADYCNSRKFNLEQIIDDTWNSVKQRDWKADPKKGETNDNL